MFEWKLILKCEILGNHNGYSKTDKRKLRVEFYISNIGQSESFDEVSSRAGQKGVIGREILIIQRIFPQEIVRLGYSK